MVRPLWLSETNGCFSCVFPIQWETIHKPIFNLEKMMDRLELDRFTVKDIFYRYTNNLIDLKPTFQRECVWTDEDRYALIESISLEYPIGLIMWNVREFVDADGVKCDNFDVVDGQQRLSTIFEYIEGMDW